VGAGRVVSTVVKVIAFLAFMAVAVFLFRKDSLQSLSKRWAMRNCPDLVQADLALMLAVEQPKVISCEGSPAQATCLVETTEKTGRKTAPVKNWDCTKRHLSSEAMTDIVTAGYLEKGETYAPGGNAAMERMQAAQRELVESVKYVTERVRERSDLLGEQ
jgi:hypothetical protein